MIRNPLLPAKAVDRQPAVSPSGLELAAAGQWGLAKLPSSEHGVTVMSPQLKRKEIYFNL